MDELKDFYIELGAFAKCKICKGFFTREGVGRHIGLLHTMSERREWNARNAKKK